MKHKHMTRVIDRVPHSRYSRSPEVHERFLGWLVRMGLDMKATSTDGAVVIERSGRRWLSVREFVFDGPGTIVPTARDGSRARIQRRSIPIESLPDWL